MNQQEIRSLLQEHSFRCTKARIGVLAFLDAQQRPCGIDRIATAVPATNLATLYRMMETFAEKGLVLAYDLGHGHKDYEVADRPHHHHAVCEHCGKVEDVFSCATVCRFERAIAQAAKDVVTISRQSTTFFGTCRACQPA